MSRERELLEKFCSSSLTYSDWLLLRSEAEELFVQPEPTAWVWNPCANRWEQVLVFGNWQEGAIYSFGNTMPKEVETKPEPIAWMNEDYEFCVNKEKNDGYPTALYTEAPKRKPFDPEERERLSKAYNTKAEQVAFEEGIIFAEISHGIGE